MSESRSRSDAAAAFPVLVRRGEPPDQEDRCEGQRDVQQEQGLPADEAHQQPAHHRPDGGRGRVGHLDPAQRPGGLHVRLLRQRPDHDDGARVRGRRAEGHDGAGHAEHGEVRRERGQRAGHGHQGHAEHEQPPRAEPVRQPAHQRLARRGGEVEGGDHPGDGGDVEPEVRAQHHQGDGDHRGVQRVQGRAQAESGDGQARPGRVAHGNSLSHGVAPKSNRTAHAGAAGRARHAGQAFGPAATGFRGGAAGSPGGGGRKTASRDACRPRSRRAITS